MDKLPPEMLIKIASNLGYRDVLSLRKAKQSFEKVLASYPQCHFAQLGSLAIIPGGMTEAGNFISSCLRHVASTRCFCRRAIPQSRAHITPTLRALLTLPNSNAKMYKLAIHFGIDPLTIEPSEGGSVDVAVGFLVAAHLEHAGVSYGSLGTFILSDQLPKTTSMYPTSREYLDFFQSKYVIRGPTCSSFESPGDVTLVEDDDESKCLSRGLLHFTIWSTNLPLGKAIWLNF